MKKLSEIEMDEYIVVGNIDVLMPKERYLESSYFIDKEPMKIYEAIEEIQNFSWEDVLKSIEDDQYENWVEDAYDAIINTPELVKAAEMVNKIFSNLPTYWQGKEIKNDMI